MKSGKELSHTARWLLGAVLLAGMSTAVTAQIATTKHNLGSTGTIVGQNQTTNTGEVCVFCHTPHGGDITYFGAPLWNKNIVTGAVYTTYSSTTMEAQKANDGVGGIGSVSLPCLSCHDGTQAMDNILNAPGSGGFSNGGGATGLVWTWTGTRVDGQGRLTGGASLGQALNDDHPIGIQYCGGGPGAATAASTACNDIAFNSVSENGGAFWVNTSGGTASKEKTDMILFNRTFPANPIGSLPAGSYPSVECATCHDPHSSTNATFLRTANTGSAVCLACHIK